MRELVIPRLLLDTKANIPFPQAQLTIYQPSVKEISFIESMVRPEIGDSNE